jgi:hypothetical protein
LSNCGAFEKEPEDRFHILCALLFLVSQSLVIGVIHEYNKLRRGC